MRCGVDNTEVYQAEARLHQSAKTMEIGKRKKAAHVTTFHGAQARYQSHQLSTKVSRQNLAKTSCH
jgi:hypothetical protein